MKQRSLCTALALAATMGMTPALAEVPASTALTADAVNQADPLQPATRAATLRTQILLDRVYFSPGEIDGASGGNTRKAIAGFQKRHGLPASGEIDAKTWAALSAEATPALIDYTITAIDVAGPFTPIPEDMMAKSKLDRLGYASAQEGLAEKFHASPALLERLNPGKDFTRAGEVITVPNVADMPALPKAAKVVVDQSDSTVTLLDASGTPIAQFPATTGSAHDPLPLGEWKINGVAKEPVFHYNPKLFWDADAAHAKAKVPAGPNNPVGVVWVDLSKPHYGIHGTPVPSTVGKTESHGCIRLTNWTALALAQAVSPGMVALLQE